MGHPGRPPFRGGDRRTALDRGGYKERHMKTALRRHQMFIGGQWVDSTGNQVQEVKNPALGEVIATVPKGTAEDVDRAAKAARKAYDEAWASSTPPQRRQMQPKLA